MDYIRAFLAGGVICALVQILMEKTKMMPGRIMVLLVVSGAVFGAAGIYEPFKNGPELEQVFHSWKLETSCGRV